MKEIPSLGVTGRDFDLQGQRLTDYANQGNNPSERFTQTMLK